MSFVYLYRLSWLRHHAGRFLVGSSYGVLSLCDISDLTQQSEDEMWAKQGRQDPVPLVRTYPAFERLTSVHGNCRDEYVLVSGYSHGVRLLDLHTGAVVRDLNNIHDDHINISR